MRMISLTLALVVLAAAGAARAAEKAPAAETDALFVAVPPLTVPLVRGSAFHGRFFVHIDLAVESEAAQARIEALQPRLEAAYLESLSLLAQYHLDPGRAVDLPLVRKLLQRTTDRVLTPGMARVLIQEAAVRR